MAKFRTCGEQLPPGVAYTESDALVTFMITGTDSTVGVVDMAAIATDYVAAGLSSDGGFLICIESAAAIEVQLINGDDFTITAVQADAYLGQWYPAKIAKVYKTGTTGTFSVGR